MMLVDGCGKGNSEMKKKRIFRVLVMFLVVIGLFLVLIWRTKFRIIDGGFCVGNSIVTPYAYTVYADHVVLDKYHGSKEEVTIPKTIFFKPVTEIGYKCFAENTDITAVNLNENIEVINELAFIDCENLTSVIGGINVVSIESAAFKRCTKLEKVDVGSKLEIIGKVVFGNCKSLKSLDNQSNIVSIGAMAFWESGLEEFKFSKDAEVGDLVFKNTSWIKNQEEEFVVYGDGNLIGYTGNDDIVVIPEGIKVLVGGCFEGTTAKEIYISNTVTSIGEMPFFNCADIRVYIPDSVVHIENPDMNYPELDNKFTLTIITTQDSFAHKYAMENDIPFEIVEGW